MFEFIDKPADGPGRRVLVVWNWWTRALKTACRLCRLNRSPACADLFFICFSSAGKHLWRWWRHKCLHRLNTDSADRKLVCSRSVFRKRNRSAGFVRALRIKVINSWLFESLTLHFLEQVIALLYSQARSSVPPRSHWWIYYSKV